MNDITKNILYPFFLESKVRCGKKREKEVSDWSRFEPNDCAGRGLVIEYTVNSNNRSDAGMTVRGRTGPEEVFS